MIKIVAVFVVILLDRLEAPCRINVVGPVVLLVVLFRLSVWNLRRVLSVGLRLDFWVRRILFQDVLSEFDPFLEDVLLDFFVNFLLVI